MPETRADIRRLVRFKLMAWPEQSTTLTTTVNSTITTIVLTSTASMIARQLIEMDSEVMRILSVDSGTNLTVMRKDQGSTAVAHDSGVAVNSYPFWGWTDSELNLLLNLAFDWCAPEIWFGKYYENSFLVNTKEFGLPSGVRYPEGDIVKTVELADDNNPAQYRAVYNWRHHMDRLIFDRPMDKTRASRILVQSAHPRLTDDTTQLANSAPVDALVQYTTAKALENLLGNRTKYVEYSASLNDRASTPDELQRQVYFYYNQAVLAKERASRVGLAGFASVRRQA